MKHRILLALALSFLLLATLAACGGTPTITPTGSQTIKVIEGDFYIHSSQTSFVTGVSYNFEITNAGQHNHDFLIMHPMDTGLMIMDTVYTEAQASLNNIAPGQSKTLNFIFEHTAQAGVLEFSDHYGGQYQAGMHLSIVVNAAAGASVTPYPNNGIPATAASKSTIKAGSACDAPVTVNIGANDVYSPQSVSIKQGDTLVFVNPTPQSFTLTTTPDAGIPFTVVDPSETQPTPFPHAGNFTVSSLEHPNDTLMVYVSSISGVTCGYTPVATVNFDASYTGSQAHYFFTPGTVTIRENQSIVLSNLTDQSKMTYTSTPDADLGNIVLDTNENQLLIFGDIGKYTITCAQFPQETFTVVVLDS